MSDEFASISAELFSQKYLFDRKQQKLDALSELRKEDLVKHYDNVFFSNETKRLDIESMSPSQFDQQQIDLAVNSGDPFFNSRVIYN